MRPRVALLALLLATGTAAAQEGTSQADPRNHSWVLEGVLAIGGGGLTVGHVDWLHAQGFRAIGDFRAEHQDPADHIRAKDMAFLDIPVAHAVDLNVTQLRTFLAWAKAQEAAGRPMYVHCTNGWHRAAAFAMAWEMERYGLSYDEALKKAVERRPGTVGRAPGPLLALESQLSGKPGVTVMLISDLSRPEPNETMPVTVEVRVDGRPAPDARVKVWSEESGLHLRGTTDAEGRFVFTYRAPANQAMDHLYARASVPGYVDGADQVELFYILPAKRGAPVEIHVNDTRDGLHVKVKEGGHRVPARIVASTPSGWVAFDSSARGEVMLPRPPLHEVVTIRAESWGSQPNTTTIDLRPPPTPSPPPAPSPSPPPTPEPPEPTPSPVVEPAPSPAPEPIPSPAPAPTPSPTPGPSPETLPMPQPGPQESTARPVPALPLIATLAAALLVAWRRAAR